MFIGRENELSQLNRLYASGRFEFAVIYGRRRVGKTAIINEFIKNKKAVFFTGVESNAKQNLENLSRYLQNFRPALLPTPHFHPFRQRLNMYSVCPKMNG